MAVNFGFSRPEPLRKKRSKGKFGRKKEVRNREKDRSFVKSCLKL
jgi:hypothetical protein